MADALVYDIPEVSRILHCGRTTVYSLLRTGQLGSIKVGRRTLIPHDALLRFIDAAQNPPQEKT